MNTSLMRMLRVGLGIHKMEINCLKYLNGPFWGETSHGRNYQGQHVLLPVSLYVGVLKIDKSLPTTTI